MKTILLHGLGQTPASWDKTLCAMGGGGDILCPDLFAWLEHQDACYPVLYRTFSAYCQQFPGPVRLCGLSLGSILALHYGIEHPQEVHSLALIAPQYTMPKRLLQFQNLLFRWMPEKNFQGVGLCKKDFLRLTGSMMDLDFSQELHRLACPVLILCGEKDSANRSAAQGLRSRLAQAELRTVKNAGHEVNREAPEELGRLLSDFFQL